MPAYTWTCQVCAASNPVGADACSKCDSSATLSAVEIDQRRRALFPGAQHEPLHGAIYTFLSKPSGWLLLAYALVAGFSTVEAAACGGDMCGGFFLLTFFVLLPSSVLFIPALLVGNTTLTTVTVVSVLVVNIYLVRVWAQHRTRQMSNGSERMRPNFTVNRTPPGSAGRGERLVGAGYLTR